MVFSLFKKKFPKLVAAGDRYYDRGVLGMARGEYAAALERFGDKDDSAEKARVEARLRQVHLTLAEQRAADAKRSHERGDFDDAIGAWEAVIDLARGYDEACVAEAVAAIEAANTAALTAVDDIAVAAVEAGADEEFELLIQGFDEARFDTYCDFGREFRDGYLALNAGDAAQALIHFDAVEADSPWLTYERGRTLALADRLDDAIVALRAAIGALEGRDALPPLTHLFPVAIRAEQYDAAEEAIRGCEALGEGEDDLRNAALMRAELCRVRGDLDGAVKILRKRLEKTPGALVVWRSLAQILEHADRPTEAIEAYEQVLSLRWRFDPDRRVVDCDVYSASRVAALLVERGERLDRALQLTNALDMLVDATDGWAISMLRARALHAKGDADAAKAAITQALDELHPEAPEEAQTRLEAARAEIEASA